jgi:hypothetical protein
MTDHSLSALLPALDIAAFARASDGSFRSLGPLPAWFPLLSRDDTFPFLGHILEEATAFWDSGVNGVREWGPCTAVEESGREFHYRVKAVQLEAGAYLVFQLDEGAEQLRQILQKARGDALRVVQESSGADLPTGERTRDV